jgi:hypothetical protein
MKMAHATRTFWTQAEALEFIAERQKDVNSVNRSKNDYLFVFLFFISVKFCIYSLLNHNRMEHDDIKLLILIFLFMNISKFGWFWF